MLERVPERGGCSRKMFRSPTWDARVTPDPSCRPAPGRGSDPARPKELDTTPVAALFHAVGGSERPHFGTPKLARSEIATRCGAVPPRARARAEALAGACPRRPQHGRRDEARARLLMLEAVVPRGDTPDPSKLGDVASCPCSRAGASGPKRSPATPRPTPGSGSTGSCICLRGPCAQQLIELSAKDDPLNGRARTRFGRLGT